MDEFTTTLQSLLCKLRARIGPQLAQAISVTGHLADGTVNVDVCLRDLCRETRDEALDIALDVADEFMGALAISYRFVDRDTFDTRPEEARVRPASVTISCGSARSMRCP